MVKNDYIKKYNIIFLKTILDYKYNKCNIMNRKKTGVRYLDTNFGIKNGRTACYLKFGICLENIPYIDMLTNCDEFNRFLQENNLEYWSVNDDDDYQLHVIGECVGYTYCNPEDKFDESLGKKIALTRAQEIAFGMTQSFYNFIENIFLKAANEFDVLGENSETAMLKCNEHINKLIG